MSNETTDLSLESVKQDYAAIAEACAEGNESQCARLGVTYAGAAACAYVTGGLAAECGWLTDQVVGRVWPYIDDSVQAVVDYTRATVSKTLMSVGLKDIPSVASVLTPINDAANNARAVIVESFVAETTAAVMIARSKLGITNNSIDVLAEDWPPELAIPSAWKPGVIVNVDHMVRLVLGATDERNRFKYVLSAPQGGTLTVDGPSGGWATKSVERNAWNHADVHKWCAERLSEAKQTDLRLLQQAMRETVIRLLLLESKNPETNAAINRKALAAKLLTSLRFVSTAEQMAKRVSAMTPIAPKAAPTSAPRASGYSSTSTDARMRMFAVGIGMAAAVGIGLALANGDKRQ